MSKKRLSGHNEVLGLCITKPWSRRQKMCICWFADECRNDCNFWKI